MLRERGRARDSQRCSECAEDGFAARRARFGAARCMIAWPVRTHTRACMHACMHRWMDGCMHACARECAYLNVRAWWQRAVCPAACAYTRPPPRYAASIPECLLFRARPADPVLVSDFWPLTFSAGGCASACQANRVCQSRERRGGLLQTDLQERAQTPSASGQAQIDRR